ncbi:MAG: response regulator [Gemmatimonadota bacterium]|nr:response regulator [Gemmatimonadota bacterium]
MTGARVPIWRALRAGVRRRPLGVKLSWLTAVLTAVVVGVSLLVVQLRARENTRRVFADELARNQRTLADLQRRNFEQMLFGASLVSTAPTLRAALAGARQDAIAGARPNPILLATVQQAIADLLRETGKDLLAVADDSGRVFVSAVRGGSPLPRRMDLSRMPAMRGALDPAAPADSGGLAVLRAPDALYQVAVYPLVLDGYTLGAVVLGERVDFAFASALRPGPDGQVLVASGGRVVLGTVSLSPGVTVPPRPTPGPTMLRVDGQDQVAAGVSLGVDQDGAPVAFWLLRPLAPTVQALTRPLLWNFLLVGVLAVLVAGGVGALVARSVLRPLADFVRYLRSPDAAAPGGRGFDAADASAEVRALGESFAELMASLTAKQRQLERRTAELAAANAGLTEEVRERERVEQALRDSEAQLRQSQKMEAVGRLAGGVAHDFNNLLTVISGYTQLAMRRGDRKPEGVDELKEVVAAADRAANLTHQLLAFSRKQVLKPAVLDLGAVVDGVAPMLRRLIGEHIDLAIERSEPLARVLADRGQLEQVILNLAVNARDAMPNGGAITLITSNVSAGGPGDAADAVGVALRVRDTGVGIAPELRERIFEPFFTTKEVGKGTGLGLSTVYGIVQQSGGTIDVESTIGLGTTFTVILPVVRQDEAGDAPVDDAGGLPRGAETILLVEDETGVRNLARRTLEELGYVVVAAADPREALAAAADVNADVVLTDIIMPVMSGPRFVERYHALHPPAAVVYMSGYADDALPNLEVEGGAIFLRKPFSPTVLAHVVRDALDRRPRRSGAGHAHA